MKTRLLLFCPWLLSSSLLSAWLSPPITPHLSVLECWTCSWKLLMRTESWEAAANIFDVLQFLHPLLIPWVNSRPSGTLMVSTGEAEITPWLLISVLMPTHLRLSLLKLVLSEEQLGRKCFHLYACLSERSNYFSSCSTDCISMASSIWAFHRTCILSEIASVIRRPNRCKTQTFASKIGFRCLLFIKHADFLLWAQ